MRSWAIRLRGGAYDGWEADTDKDPALVLVAWKCVPGVGCHGHGTFDPESPNIVLRTAESYRRVEVDLDERLAVYEVGVADPEAGGDDVVVEFEPVGVGAEEYEKVLYG